MVLGYASRPRPAVAQTSSAATPSRPGSGRTSECVAEHDPPNYRTEVAWILTTRRPASDYPMPGGVFQSE